MKKMLSLILAIGLVFGLVSFASAKSYVEESASDTFGVDVVVVLDMTSSMDNRDNNNDPEGYRLDATAMLVGMLDMEGSRIAVVPFAAYPFEESDGAQPLTVVNDSAVRKAMLTTLYSHKETKGNTNIGAALMKANQILLEREDKTNRPMIVLMTDGKNSIVNNGVTVPHSLRWSNGEIIDEGKKNYTTSTAVEVTKEAAECASELGYPIYTVALNTDPDDKELSDPSSLSMREISQMTGVDTEKGCFKVEKSQAKELPVFFAQILADKIGSSVQHSAKPESIGTDTYEVSIPILNRSVQETNIVLPVRTQKNPLSDIDASSIRVYDESGKVLTDEDNASVLVDTRNSHFAMVKIREPRTAGVYKLRFESGTEPGTDIKFNILYNYDIKMGASVSAGGQDEVFYKSDKLEIISNFLDGNGNASEDESLYADHTGEDGYEDWMTIREKWELFRAREDGTAYGEAVKTGELSAHPMQMRFDTEIDLSVDTPDSGNYRLVIAADGAGLTRRVEIPLVLMNHHPAGGDYKMTIGVNSTVAGEEGTWTVEGSSGTLPVRAGEIITDADNDPLQFELNPEGNEEQAAEMKLDPSDGTISYTTKLNSAGTGILDGKAVYRLFYTDQDTGDPGRDSVLITLDIQSDVAAMLAKYEPELTIEGTEAGTDQYRKNSEIKFLVRLKNRDGSGWDDGTVINTMTRDIRITDQENGQSLMTGGGNLEPEDGCLTYTIENTGNHSAEWNITVSVGPFEPVVKTITIPNLEAPQAAAMEDVVINCDGERVPSFIRGIIGEDTPGDDPGRNAEVAKLFTDKDGEPLSYSDPEFVTADTDESMPGNTLTAQVSGEEGKYLITAGGETTSLFSYSYKGQMRITASDGDEETGTYVRNITVVDLYNKMLTILVIIAIAIVILIILILIIHQIRKPRFPKLNLTIREEPSLYESGSEPLSPVKTATNANAIGIDSDMAAKHGISVEQLQNIIISPIRSTTSVGVSCKKIMPGHEISLEDVRLKAKKKYTWKIDQELAVRSQNGDGLIAVKLENRREDEADEIDDLSSGEWTEDQDFGEIGSSSSRRHSRKVEKKQKPVEEESSSGSTDDFDF